MRRGYKKQENRRYYLLNERIPGLSFRVIDDKGKQIGIFSREQAFNLAKEKELDLVLIADKANPPVVKLIDFKKFLYQENKKLKKAKKGIKKSLTKDLKLSLFIKEADLTRLVKKGQEFVNEGHQLRLILTLKGREITKKTMAFNLINQYIGLLKNIKITTAPKVQGKTIYCVIARSK